MTHYDGLRKPRKQASFAFTGAVHVLVEGRPLCGAHAGLLPAEWPDGERWVRLDDALGDASKVTCARCREQMGRRRSGT